MKKSKTAILWGCNDLLAQSMEFFIKAEEQWEVIRMSTDTDVDVLLDQIEKIHPNVIILYAENGTRNPHLIMQLIEKQPNLKVITVSLEDNRMQVYCKRSVTVQKVSDLLSIIEERHFSGHSVEKQEEVNTHEINP
jgi:DNA-binding NarL/FixJ family response regulator